MKIEYKCSFCANTLSLTGDICWDKTEIKVGICKKCDLKQLLSFSHVDLDYYSADDHFPEDIAPLRNREHHWNQKRIERLVNYIPGVENKKILDFGSGHGGFLEQAQGSFRDIYGYEVSGRTCALHNQAGWRCCQFLTDVPADREVILLFHVLEHIPDPQQFLEQLQDNFPQAKTFVIEVPNDNEALNSLFENKAYQKNQHSSEHLYYFNSKTLRSVVESSNLEVRTETQLQRYTLANHFGWLKNQKRGGQNIWETFNERGLNDSYEKILIDQGVADSLFFICTRKG